MANMDFRTSLNEAWGPGLTQAKKDSPTKLNEKLSVSEGKRGTNPRSHPQLAQIWVGLEGGSGQKKQEAGN